MDHDESGKPWVYTFTEEAEKLLCSIEDGAQKAMAQQGAIMHDPNILPEEDDAIEALRTPSDSKLADHVVKMAINMHVLYGTLDCCLSNVASFKVSPETAELLVNFLGNCPEINNRMTAGGRLPIPLSKKLLMTLRYLCSQETVRELSDHFGVTPSSLIRCKRQIIQAIVNNLQTKFIHWPEDCAEVAKRFKDMTVNNRGNQWLPHPY